VIGRSFDPTPDYRARHLREIVEQGHQKVWAIPWFEFGFMAPADSDQQNVTQLVDQWDGSQI